MLTVELRDVTGRVPIQFDILPTGGLPDFIIESQFKTAREYGSVLGLQYYFLVSSDRVRGWKIEGGLVFDHPTEKLLVLYAGTAERVRGARAGYLAELTQAWVADLASHWKSIGVVAPGEIEMEHAGALRVIRSSKPSTSGAS